MPRVSEFFGITIYMYYRDHAPPHFHAFYSEYEVEINIKTLEIIKGKMPPKIKKLILEWSKIYQKELKKNWELLKQREPLKKILPLK